MSKPAFIAGDWGDESLESYETYESDLYAVGRDDLDRFAAACVRGRPHAAILQSSQDNIQRQFLDADSLAEQL